MKIKICNGRACSDKFSNYIKDRLENDIEKFEIDNVKIEDSMCSGNCGTAPNIFFDSHLETKISPIKASKIMLEKVKHRFKKSK